MVKYWSYKYLASYNYNYIVAKGENSQSIRQVTVLLEHVNYFIDPNSSVQQKKETAGDYT